ncbi:MAG TPA: CPBP family glutamic-type intramembrane protease, partial [Anaerolineales bacterium]|nr:CPBP family glutamic-type intramembrane protease [Anaerolineales bacterium]
AILLGALARLGWLRPAGFASLGQPSLWLVMLLPLVYAIGASAYALTGNFNFGFTDPAQTGLAALFITAAVFLEEVAFRGLVLYAFVRVWGDTNRGLIKSVVVASLFFSSFHLLDFLSGRPLPNVLAQTVEAFVLGIILGALLLVARSIYPAAFFHFALNFAGYLNYAGKGLEDSPSAWLNLSLLLLPLALISIYLLRGVQTNRVFLRQSSVGD